MNSCSKFFILVLVLFCSASSWALQVQALYTSPCQREIGIILHTDKRYVHLLNLDGKFKKIGRYQIQNLSSYSLDHLPLSGEHLVPSTIPSYRFFHSTTEGGLSPLAEGIVLGHTQTGYQLLDNQGRDAYVPFQSLWKIEKIEEAHKLDLKKQSSGQYQFAHPTKGLCPSEAPSGRETIYASEMLTDPIVIKRHLDRQITALQKLERQRESQIFYPVPQVYKNGTQIGYWLPLGNRYGGAQGRDSGLAPLIRNEFSSGPFGFQHLSLTGAGPIPGTIHEEPQTMLYYSFKSSYISFSGMLDPSLILAGSQYQWAKDDMLNGDNRVVESSHLALGFDRGHWSVKFFLHSHLFGGYRHSGLFTRYDGDMSRVMLSWQDRHWTMSLATDLSSSLKSKKDDDITWDDGELKFLRADVSWQLPREFKVELWVIRRNVLFEEESGPDTYENSSLTLGTGLEFPMGKRWSLAGRLSHESVDTTGSLEEKKWSFIKLATGVYLDF